MKTALLGTGLLGTAIAEAMIARGEPLTVWNRTPDKARAIAGAHVAESAREAAEGAARVHLVLSGDDAVDAVLAEIDPRGVVIDHSTTLPARTRARAGLLKNGFVSAPCFMTPQTARERKGMILASGAGYERVKDALAAMTGDVWYLGERAELAVTYKLCGNAVQMAVMAALADAIAMARATGVDPNDMAELFTRYDVVRSLPSRAKKMARGDTTPSFSLAMARKDIGLMLAVAPSETLASIAARMDAAIAAGLGDRDYGAISGRE